jgi:RHS repeat-associated protein
MASHNSPYDAHDRPTSVADPNGNSTLYVYDGFGDAIEQTSPDSGVTVFYFDKDGNLTHKFNSAASVVGALVANYGYDALDRVLTTTYIGDPSENVAYTYDQSGHGFGIGRLTSLTDASGSLSRTYDERGNMLTEQRVNGSTPLTTTYAYDKASRVASIGYPSGALVTYNRDAAGRVNSMPFSASGSDANSVGTYTHLPFGPITATTFNNGVQLAQTFDLDYRITGITTSINNQNLTYGYDQANNVTSITDAVNPSNSQTMGYDVLNRLTGATNGAGGYGDLLWAYDANGNLLSSTAAGTTYNYTYKPQTNRLAGATWPGNSQTFSYTATGNISGITQNGSSIFTAGYNKANRLASVTGIPLAMNLTYDAFGKRITKANPGSSPIIYTFDLDRNLIEEDDNGTFIDHIYVDGTLVGDWQPSEGHLFFVQGDRFGTPQLATDHNGATDWQATYLPYGATYTLITSGPGGSVTLNVRLPGQYFDHEDNLHYNGFRDYIPNLGQYLQADPAGAVGGLNAYTYAEENPATYVDPEGLLYLYIWYAGGSGGRWGHVSITLDDNTHISWWPGQAGPGWGGMNWPIYSSPPLGVLDLATDNSLEGGPPNANIRIDGLDEAAIENWWNSFRSRNNWRSLNQNCATTAADALAAGGGDIYAVLGGGLPTRLVWAPSDVQEYATHINNGLDLSHTIGHPRPN